ncbi:histone-lysine N-methyltransferase SETMAR [Plakobranchus ocellatus]|uniref:Histone-lysine N-methyltransferase SETMAR n=1 Tax=Plakobranchus ocellatus TaxID=259542 RepID=A0AAV4AU06_9GAST|nr:histone-lysine N-methyltransferase SETMAR [Plakobranchus ocellatus]
MSRSRVYQWCTWFGEGRTSLGDEPKSGRPKTTTNEENTTRVDELIRFHNTVISGFQALRQGREPVSGLDRRVPADLRKDSLTTEPSTSRFDTAEK